mgnify:CR=1 FL=1
MQWITVDSSRISRLRYSAKTGVLQVQFKRGRVYEYAPVSPDTFNRIVSAPSVGTALRRDVIDMEIGVREIALMDEDDTALTS